MVITMAVQDTVLTIEKTTIKIDAPKETASIPIRKPSQTAMEKEITEGETKNQERAE